MEGMENENKTGCCVKTNITTPHCYYLDITDARLILITQKLDFPL